MAQLKKSEFQSATKRISGLPEARRERIADIAAEMLTSLHLSQIRKALSVTQKDLAERTSMAQGEISRLENAELTASKIGTLDRYVSGMGGRLRLVAEMPDGTIAEIPLHNGKPVKSRVRAA